MSRSGGMSQLLKGIIIGVVLIMAIIGTMSLLDKDGPLSSLITNNSDQTTTQDISAPSITLNPDNTQSTIGTQNNSNIGDLNAEIVDNTNNPILSQQIAKEEAANEEDMVKKSIANEVTTVNDDAIQPILEDERTPEEAIVSQDKPITYGMMEINSINPSNNQELKANYRVFDQKNAKVAESNDATNASYRLPIGQYKVETTLTKIDDATNQVIPVLTKSRYIIVRTNTTSKQTFQLEPPAATGVLQVSAKMNEQNIRADFIIQQENGEVITSRKNVTSSLFKLDTGTYKVSVNSGNNRDFKSVEVKAGESTQTVFTLKQAAEQGKLLVRVFDARSSNPMRADISIINANGSIIQDIKASTQTELSLAPGDYSIKVIGPNGTSNKNIKMRAGLALDEVFRFEWPNTEIAAEDSSQTNGTQITDNVTIKAIEAPSMKTTEPENAVDSDNNDAGKVTLNIVVQDEQTKKPMKSNIYIQTPTGMHLDKRTYVESANFSLLPGIYKVTVRANNRNNTIKTIRLDKNQNTSEVFLLINPNNNTEDQSTEDSVSAPVKSALPINKPTTIVATGFLNVSMQAPKNQRVNQDKLRTHFIVTKSSGEKIVELTSVNTANFKLDVGAYNVTAINNNKRLTQRVNINPNQNSRLIFNTNDFQSPKGVLRSRIVDELGRPLKGNLTVSNTAGQIVARANGVSTAVFDLPPARHTVSVNYQGLSGSEAVNVNANETTIQTFTIAPNRNPQ